MARQLTVNRYMERPSTFGGFEVLGTFLSMRAGTLHAQNPTTVRYMRSRWSLPNQREPVPTDIQEFTRNRISFLAVDTMAQLSQSFMQQPTESRPVVIGAEDGDVDIGFGESLERFGMYTLHCQISRKEYSNVRRKWENSLVLIHRHQDDGGPTEYDMHVDGSRLHLKAYYGYVRNFSTALPAVLRASPLPVWRSSDGGMPKRYEPTVATAIEVYFAINELDSSPPSFTKKTSIRETMRQSPGKRLMLTRVGSLAPLNRLVRTATAAIISPDRPVPRFGDWNPVLLPSAAISPLYMRLIDPFADANAPLLGRAQPGNLRDAFRSLMHYHDHGFMVAIGGPGVGKTSTVATMILERYRANSNFRCLVTTPSNAAADVFYKALTRNCADETLDIIRIGDQAKMDDRVVAHSDARKSAMKKRVRNEHQDLYLSQARIVVTTLGSSQQMPLLMNRDRMGFTCWVVDEAGQANDAELFLPIIYPTLRHIVLIGDDAQLGPTVISPILESYPAGRLNFFSRLCEQLRNRAAQFPEPLFVRLQPQRRMRPLVSRLVSLLSYDSQEDRLQDDHRAGEQTMRPVRFPPLLVFSGNNWSEELNYRTRSYSSPNEAGFIINLLRATLERAGYIWDRREWAGRSLTVAIIALYSGQVETINRLIRKEPRLMELVTVATVDSMQGSQRDIVIISCVRAFSAGTGFTIGFANDMRRLNVAISRAACIYLCAHYQTFGTQPGWAKLFRFAFEHQVYYEANRYSTAASLATLMEREAEREALDNI